MTRTIKLQENFQDQRDINTCAFGGENFHRTVRSLQNNTTIACADANRGLYASYRKYIVKDTQ